MYTLKYTLYNVKYVLVQSSGDVVVSMVFFQAYSRGMCAGRWARHARHHVLGELLRTNCSKNNALSQALNFERENFSQNNVPLKFRCVIHCTSEEG